MKPIIKNAIIVVGALVLVAGCKKKEAGATNDSTGTAPIAATDTAPVATTAPLATASATASAATVTAAATVAAATPHGPVHPAYLHALADLRNARYNLIRKGGDPAMKWDENVAIAAIDRAIREIKIAAVEDGKDLSDHQPVDANLPPRGRLHKALASLQAARNDINQEEDNAYAAGLKAKALHHINEAIALTNDGISSLH